MQSDAIVEEYIDGREIYIGVVGNSQLTTFPAWEMNFGTLSRAHAGIATRVPEPMMMLGVWALGGVIVMCAAMGRETAGEEKKLGHGYFAKAVIDGLAIQVLMNDTQVSPERMQDTCRRVASRLIGAASARWNSLSMRRRAV